MLKKLGPLPPALQNASLPWPVQSHGAERRVEPRGSSARAPLGSPFSTAKG